MIVPGPDAEVHQIIDSAATELVVRFPLAGLSLYGRAVVIRQQGDCPTAATDGRNILCGPDFLREMYTTSGTGGVTFVLLHEWAHIFFNHVGRRGDRLPKIWNIAADLYTNQQCEDILVTKTPGGGVKPEPQYIGKTVEEIYDMLLDTASKRNPEDPEKGIEEAMKGESKPENFGSGADLLPPSTDIEDVAETDAFREGFIEELLENQSLMEMNPTAKLPTAFRERFEQLKDGRVPWERLIMGRVMAELGHDCATYSPPNRRRHYPLVISPSYRALKERKLMLAIDVSYSVGQDLMRLFISSVTNAAKRATETRIVTFDSCIREDYITQDPGSILKNIRFISGAHSHTSVVDVFSIVDTYKPRSLAVLTDGFVRLPSKTYPRTMWLIPRGGCPQSWGTNYTLDIAW